MTIELNEYGFMFDMGDFIYLSLSWAFLILSALVLVGVKVYTKIKSNKKVTPILNDYNDEWMTK